MVMKERGVYCLELFDTPSSKRLQISTVFELFTSNASLSATISNVFTQCRFEVGRMLYLTKIAKPQPPAQYDTPRPFDPKPRPCPSGCP